MRDPSPRRVFLLVTYIPSLRLLESTVVGECVPNRLRPYADSVVRGDRTALVAHPWYCFPCRRLRGTSPNAASAPRQSQPFIALDWVCSFSCWHCLRMLIPHSVLATLLPTTLFSALDEGADAIAGESAAAASELVKDATTGILHISRGIAVILLVM